MSYNNMLCDKMATTTSREGDTMKPPGALAMATMAPTNEYIAKSTTNIGELAEPCDSEEAVGGSTGDKNDPSHNVEQPGANSNGNDYGALDPTVALNANDHDPGEKKQREDTAQPIPMNNKHQQQQKQQQQQRQQHQPHHNHHHKPHHNRRRHIRNPTRRAEPFSSGQQEHYSSHPLALRPQKSNQHLQSITFDSSLQPQPAKRNNKRRHSSLHQENILSEIENENEYHSAKKHLEKSKGPLATKSFSNTNGNFNSPAKKVTHRRNRSHRNQRRHEIASWFVDPRLDISFQGGEGNPPAKTMEADINISMNNSVSKNDEGGIEGMGAKATLEREKEVIDRNEATESVNATPANDENVRHDDIHTLLVDNLSKVKNQIPTNTKENEENKTASTLTPHTELKETERQPQSEEMDTIEVTKPTNTFPFQETKHHPTPHRDDPNSDLHEKVETGERFVNLNSLSEGENWVVCSFYDNVGESHNMFAKGIGDIRNNFITNDTASACANASGGDEANTPTPLVASSSPRKHSLHQQPLHLSIVKSHRNLYVEDGRIKGRTFPPPVSRIGDASTVEAPKVADNFLKKDDSTKEGGDAIERVADSENGENIDMGELGKGGKTDFERAQFVSKRDVNAVHREFAKSQKTLGSGVAVLCIDVDYDGNFVAVKDIRVGLTPAMQQEQYQQHYHIQSQQIQNQDLEIHPLNASGRISENRNETHYSKRELQELQLAEELELFLVRRKPMHKQKLESQLPTEAKSGAVGVDPNTKLEDMELESSKHDSEDDLMASGSDSNKDSSHNKGYDTDDEKEGDDDMEELNERSSEVRVCEDVVPLLERNEVGVINISERGLKGRTHCRKPWVHFRPPPPREEDVDNDGHPLYHEPETLPRRQLRVLREGDRILMRYWPLSSSNQLGGKEPRDGCPCVAKFEYIYERDHHKQRLPRKPKEASVQVADTPISLRMSSPVAAVACNKSLADSSPAVSVTVPRLLSVKSDVKSEGKNQFTLNSTSAAEAPTDDNASEHAKKLARAVERQKAESRNHDHHHQHCHYGEVPFDDQRNGLVEADASRRKTLVQDWAGKDWSAVESENEGAEGIGGDIGKEGKETNIGQNDVEDDDDGMEEYSYLTGEVVIKDQDYISAITGDDATMPSAVAREDGDEGEYDQVPYDGEDAATASAVVLGAATSPSKSAAVAGRTLRGLRHAEKKDDLCRDEFFGTGSCTPKRATSNAYTSEGHISRSSGRKSCYRTESLVLEAVVRAPERNELDAFFTPASREDDSDETGIRSEDELLSQPADNESSQILGGAKSSSRELVSGQGNNGKDIRVSEEKPNDANKDEEEDVSLTQPFPIPADIKLSHKGDDQDDDTTDVSMTLQIQKRIPANGEVKSSAEEGKDDTFAKPPNLGVQADPDKSEQPGGDSGCPDNNVYDQPTQDFVVPELSNKHNKDDEEFQFHTQFEAPPLPSGFAAKVNSLQHDEKRAQTGSIAETNCDDDEEDEHGIACIIEDEKPSASSKAELAIDTKIGMIQGSKVYNAKGIETQPDPIAKYSKKATKFHQHNSHEVSQKKKRSRRVSERRAAPNTGYDNSALQTQRVQNSAVHRVRSGAIMTGPVDGTSLDLGCGVGLSSPRAPHPDLRRAEKDLLTSIALLSNDPNPTPLPDAAASSEEITVCQMEDSELTKEQGSITNGVKDNLIAVDAVEQKVTGVEQKNLESEPNKGAQGGRDEGFRDPDIPTEVSFVDKGRARYRRHSNENLETPYHRSTRRQREVVFSEIRSDTESEPIRVMFTGITPTSRHKRMIDSIGADLVESIEEAASATHVIVSDGKSKLRRTPKLMICISKVSKILSIDWLERSAMERKILPTDDFLLLHDKEAEKTYNFSMKETIENGIAARRESGGVLGGWSVYICANVAGNRAPSIKELTLIILAAGGELIDSLSEPNVPEPSKAIILTSDPSTTAQRKEDGVERVERLGAKVATTSWLFHTVITQKISDDYGCSAGTPIHDNTDGVTPQSGNQRAKRKLSERNVSPNHGNRRRSTRTRG